jgi:hypothetical protein
VCLTETNYTFLGLLEPTIYYARIKSVNIRGAISFHVWWLTSVFVAYECIDIIWIINGHNWSNGRLGIKLWTQLIQWDGLESNYGHNWSNGMAWNQTIRLNPATFLCTSQYRIYIITSFIDISIFSSLRVNRWYAVSMDCYFVRYT